MPTLPTQPVTRVEFQQALRDFPPHTFADLVTLMHTLKYTGAVTIHAIHGVVTSAEVAGLSVHVRLDRPALASTGS